MDQEPQNPEFEPRSNAITRVRGFLLDQGIPLWKRLLPVAVIGLILILFFSCGSEPSPDLARTPEDIMGPPDADTGLGAPDTEDERLLAKIQQQQPAEKFDVEDLDLEEFDSEEEKAIREAEAEDEKEAAALRTQQEAALQADTPFTAYPRLSLNPVELAQGPDGSVYVADKAALIRFDPTLTKPEILLDAALYDREFNEEMPSLSTVYVAPDEAVWLGFFRGQVAQYHRYAWRMMLRSGEPISGRVFDIKSDGDSTFIAGRGLWRWDQSYQRALSAENLQQRRFSSLLMGSDNELYAAGLGGVWRYDRAERDWRALWKPRRQDGGAHTMAERHDGRLLIGTSNGIVEISKQGVVTDHLLVGEVISGIFEDKKKHLLVATRQHGLFLWNGEAWFRAGKAQGVADRIDELLVDTRDRLWLAASRDGLFVAPRAAVEEWITKFPEEIAGNQFTEPKIFADACEAAGSVLQGITLSKGVALEVLDGVTHVFFDGTQVCPKGFGYRRPDGTVVTQQGWTLTIFRERAREVVEIPKEFAADQNTALFLDSKERVWIGTTEYGVYRYANKQWTAFGAEKQLTKNRIRKILEDSTGRIWFASNPTLDRVNRVFLGAPISIYEDTARSGNAQQKPAGADAGTWTSISPAQRLGSWAANDLIEVDATTMFVATMHGFSLLKPGSIVNFSARDKIDPVYSYAASMDGNATIWIAHQFFGDGITRFDGISVTHTTSKDGLFSERIVDVTHDRQGRIWLMAATGQVGVYPRSYFANRGRTTEFPPRKQVALK